jgi:hypothetical protein
MERFNALERGTQLMLVGALLLFIDLFFTWQDSEEVLGVDVPVAFKGWEGIGLIVGILTIVILAWAVVRLASVNVALPVSNAMTAALLAALVLIFTVIKMLTILGNDPTIWAWIGLALAVVVAVGGFMTVQEAGGVDTLRQEATSLGSSGSDAGTSASAAAAPPPPPVETSPPAQSTPEPPASAPGAPADTTPDAPAGDEPSTERGA